MSKALEVVFKVSMLGLAIWLSCTWAVGEWGQSSGSGGDCEVFCRMLCIWIPWFSLSYTRDYPAFNPLGSKEG